MYPIFFFFMLCTDSGLCCSLSAGACQYLAQVITSCHPGYATDYGNVSQVCGYCTHTPLRLIIPPDFL